MGLMVAGMIRQQRLVSGVHQTGMTCSPNDTSRRRTGISAFLFEFVDPTRNSDIGRIFKLLENEQVAGCHRAVTGPSKQRVAGSSPAGPANLFSQLQTPKKSRGRHRGRL